MSILAYLQVLFAADLKRFQDIPSVTPVNMKSSSGKVSITNSYYMIVGVDQAQLYRIILHLASNSLLIMKKLGSDDRRTN